MSFVAVAILGSAAIGAGASIYGAYTQSQAAQQAQQTLAQQEGMTLSTINQYLKPYAQAGTDVLPTLKSLITPGPSQTAALSQTPGFQFAQDWGLKGVQNVQSTRGLGGNALAAGATFAGGLAANTWSDVVNKLLTVYGQGGQAAGQAAGTTAQTAGAFAPGIAQTQIGQANALAGGAVGASNAFGGISNAMVLNALSGGKLFGGMYGSQQQPGPVQYTGGPFQAAG